MLIAEARLLIEYTFKNDAISENYSLPVTVLKDSLWFFFINFALILWIFTEVEGN